MEESKWIVPLPIPASRARSSNMVFLLPYRQEPFDGIKTRSAYRHFIFGYRHQCDS